MPSLITLTTDFGLSDPFVGIMKGVILKIAPTVQLVDITHQIESQNIEQAARILDSFWTYFPKKSIHLVVVDPGVGGKRKPIVVKHKQHIFIGPDNGVLSPILSSQSKAYEISKDKYFLNPVSTTFHGRDIFAPIAAHLANKVQIRSFGTKLSNPNVIELIQPRYNGKYLSGEVTYIDRFGNMMTNLKLTDIEPHLSKKGDWFLKCGRHKIKGLSQTYSEKKIGELGAIINSWGYLEIFCYKSNASKNFKKPLGISVKIF